LQCIVTIKGRANSDARATMRETRAADLGIYNSRWGPINKPIIDTRIGVTRSSIKKTRGTAALRVAYKHTAVMLNGILEFI
jgi:hypothetical protein